MRRVLKILLVILLLLQLPFLLSLFESWRAKAYLQGLQAQKTNPETPFLDLRGTIHVHSSAGSHSLGTYPEIIAAAKAAGYRYVFITEHTHPKAELFRRLQSDDLITIYGKEVELEDGTRVLVSEEGGPEFDPLTIVSEMVSSKLPQGADAIEVFNLHSSAQRQQNFFEWINLAYQQAFFSRYFRFHLLEFDFERIRTWDRLLLTRHLTATGGNDAHQNIGVRMLTASGQEVFSIQLDPYEDSFRFLTNHILLTPTAEANDASILQALREGSSYIALEAMADPTGFAFYGKRGDQIFGMGSNVPAGTELIATSPLPVRFVFLRNGSHYRELEGYRFYLNPAENGVYRVEVYPRNPPSLLEGKPWIISNPIYVGTQARQSPRDTGP